MSHNVLAEVCTPADVMSMDASVGGSPTAARPTSADAPNIGSLAHAYRTGSMPLEDHIPPSPPAELRQATQAVHDHTPSLDQPGSDMDAGPFQHQQQQQGSVHGNGKHK